MNDPSLVSLCFDTCKTLRAANTLCWLHVISCLLTIMVHDRFFFVEEMSDEYDFCLTGKMSQHFLSPNSQIGAVIFTWHTAISVT